MKRIVILGNISSGKTTIANLLSKRLLIPVYHLDLILFHEGKYIAIQEQIARLSAITKQEYWIIDGNYSLTLAMRCKRADIVIFISTNRWICAWRYIIRCISIKMMPSRKVGKFYGGCDVLDRRALGLILGYDKIQRIRYEKVVRDNAGCRVIEVSKSKDIIQLLGNDE